MAHEADHLTVVDQHHRCIGTSAQALAGLHREQAVSRVALGIQGAVGQKARAVQRNRLLQARCRVVFDKLDRATTGKEGNEYFRFTAEFRFSYGLNNLIRHDITNPLPYYGYIFKELNSNLFTLIFYFE